LQNGKQVRQVFESKPEWRQVYRDSDWTQTKRSLGATQPLSVWIQPFGRLSQSQETAKHHSISDRHSSTTASSEHCSSPSNPDDSITIRELLNDMDHTPQADLGAPSAHSSSLQTSSQSLCHHDDSSDDQMSTQSSNASSLRITLPSLLGMVVLTPSHSPNAVPAGFRDALMHQIRVSIVTSASQRSTGDDCANHSHSFHFLTCR
jgi:hypothetical protein